MNKSSLAVVALAVVALASITLAGFGGWQQLQNADIQADIDALHKSQQHWGEESQDQLDQYTNTIAALRQQLQDTQNRLMLAKAVKHVAPAVAASAEGNAAITAPQPLATNQTQTSALPPRVLPALTAIERREQMEFARKLGQDFYSQQLEFGVPRLTEQNRTYTVAAFVEVMTTPFKPADRAGKSPAEINNERDDAIVDKVKEKMDADQLQLLKDYFKYQRRMNEARSAGY